MIIAAISQFIVQLIANMTVVALPEISESLSFPAEIILWVNLIYLMGFVAFSIPLQKLSRNMELKDALN